MPMAPGTGAASATERHGRGGGLRARAAAVHHGPMTYITSPRLEGTVVVGPDRNRRLSFSEFGVPHTRAIVWLHGTPGARRQIPTEAREFAAREGIRIIGLDRPGIGLSTPHVYANFREFADDLNTVADSLGLDEMSVIGLSGGGPYTLAAARYMPDRVRSCAVLGGVAPSRGEDAIGGGLVGLGAHVAPLVALGRIPIGLGLTAFVRVAKPFASPIIDVYGKLSPEGDRNLLARPEFKAMFIDDLLNGSRKQFSAPLSDLMLFSKEWDFHLRDVEAPVHWYHGDADHIVPLAHGVHCVKQLPIAEMKVLSGESHLGGMGIAEDIITAVLADWGGGR